MALLNVIVVGNGFIKNVEISLTLFVITNLVVSWITLALLR